MAKSKGGSVVARTAQIVLPYAREMGLDIWDIQFVREGTEWCLRIIIDKEGGVGIDDCERLSRAVDKPLDDLDPTEGEWSLEVSSPGIGRELTRPEHYAKMAGREVQVKLYRPDPDTGEREFVAELKGLEDKELVLLDLDKTEFRVPLKAAVSVKLYEEIEEA